jgi:hypothetical protein
MTVHLYLSMIPEALVASMLSPEEFGVYYAVGSKKKSHGQAIFFELDPDFRGDFFKIEEGIKRCKPHEDGSPKSSIYISVYRTLEHVPMSAIQKLYLTTQDGRTLELSPSKDIPKSKEKLHLYQEIAPVSPLVVSALDPVKFYELIVEKPTMLLTLPAICFVDLRLDELAEDPEFGSVRDLPYKNIDHLRECLLDLKGKTILTKMVDRASSPNVPYRTIKTGIYVGNQKKLLFFPMPDREKLREEHYLWWRSANM